MSDEVPVLKPTAKHISQKAKYPMRPTSEGHIKTNDVPEEILKNIPSTIEEKEEEKDKYDKKASSELNINASPFYPTNKRNNENPKAKDISYSNKINNNMKGNNDKKYQDNCNKKNNNYNYNNNQNYTGPQYRNINNNYSNGNYQNNYYNPSFFQNSGQQQISYPPGYGGPSFYNTQIYMAPAPPQFPNYSMGNNYSYHKNSLQNQGYPSAAPTPLPINSQMNQNTASLQPTNSYRSQLKLGSKGYIPKSMRKAEDNLNLNAQNHTPQNLTLKKKEEEIQKFKEEEKNKKEIEKTKDKEKEKESIKEQNIKDEQKEETQKEANRNPDKNDEQKKKSNLALLLEKPESKETKKKKNKKEEGFVPQYQEKKKFNQLDKKIDELNEKDKKFKLEEEKRKKEEKMKKDEEEKKRKEEEKKRREEEERLRLEEEKKKKEEEEERKRKEEEERKRKEEEKRRKEEEEEKRKEEERRKKEEEEKNKVIEKKYFITFKNRKSDKKEYKYTFEYIMQFKKWKISNEEDLLTESTKRHFVNFKEEEKEGAKPKKKENPKSSYYNKPKNSELISNKTIKEDSAPPAAIATPENAMEQWARKDMTKEIKAAEEFKQKLEETIKDDPIKRNLRNFLNMLTKDNYDKIKQNIIDTIKEKVEYQEKFLDVLFQKAVSERAYVELYARLCKDLDKDMPQKNEAKPKKEGGKKKETSVMRGKLLDKCKEIFTIENNEKFDEYIKEKDPEERENKLKKFVLGNVYFITELIKIKILSKKIAPVCIKNLFKRYEKEEGDEKLKLINIQAIVIFTDQFGTLVHSQEKKIISKDAEEFKKSIDEIFQKLDKVKDEKGLPGYIKYKIINLIEKRKSGYQKSKLEEYRTAKSKKEVIQELENQDQITQDNINDKIKGGLEDYRDFVEEEGSSAKYPWKETTYLYDKKEKGLDDILEGYIVSCGDFIEKENNIKYAKDYIKELIEYYSDKIKKKEKKDLRIRLFNLLEIVRDYALETPQIYDIYAYVISIFIDSNIMEISDLEEIIKEKDSNEKDLKVVSDILEKAYNYYKGKIFREELSKFNYIKNNTELFKWVYNSEETEENNDD